ncbi:MAG: carboxypeptidase, partial [Chlorobiaceae bacterium]|nr:carboxypeptidase [Chlorobiaceae bacterium]
DYISSNHTDFINARRCINGTDHAGDIARLAEKFLHSL